MANNYLITGYWGEPHVTPENDRGIHAGLFGTGRFVLPVGEQFRAEYIGNNTVRMYDGKLMDNGAAAGIPAGKYVDLLIANASDGFRRNNIIAFRYTIDNATLIERGEFIVIRGPEDIESPVDPEYTQNNLLSNTAKIDHMPLYRVQMRGSSVYMIEKMFTLSENMAQAANNASTAKATAIDAKTVANEVKAAADRGDFDGAPGPAGDPGAPGQDYVLTEADKDDIADRVERVVYAPKFVASVDEMTDTEKCYALESTETLWTYSYAEATETPGTVTDQIMQTQDNPFYSGCRINYSNGTEESKAGYVISPYIDLNNYNGNTGTIKIRLSGLAWAHQSGGTNDTNARVALYDESKAWIFTNSKVGPDGWTSVTWEFDDEAAYIIMNLPYKQTSSKPVTRYLRFCAAGTWSDDYISVEYQGTITTPGGWRWRDTNIEYPPKAKEAESDIAAFTLVNPSVKDFMATADYDDSDYSYTQVTDHAGSDYFRKDQPFPVLISWGKAENAVQYTVTINTDDGILNTGMQTYYAKDNSISIYNLIPNQTYWYRVCALYADGTRAAIKDGSFNTTAEQTRMLNIGGIQNVRDIGGHSGKDGKTVKYGWIIRGSAMDEAARNILNITGDGAFELTRRVGVRTDIDLRGNRTASTIVDSADFLCIPYGNYAGAITDGTQRGYFKQMFEYIVTRINKNRPVYIHCQGGCDRTGTLVFLLLGLLGVSESDLAKEYELSSFSSIGSKSRTRNSTTYDYSGMVTALKAYSGTTITDKFVSFAVACGISTSTIDSFRNLMLE